MRRILATAIIAATTLAGAAQAETWKLYGAPNEKGIQWAYDADYAYRDVQSGRVVVMQAISKPGAEPRLGPSAPGAKDGVGNVVALDCKGKTLIMLGSYTPSKPLELSGNWRTGNASKAASVDDKALMDAVCPTAGSLATK